MTNRIGWLFAALALLPSALLAQAATDPGGQGQVEKPDAPEADCGTPGDSDLIGRVESLWAPDEGRVGVSFYGRAAIHRLPAVHPCLKRWMPLIERSLDHGTLVRVSFDIGTQEITRVTSASADDADAADPPPEETGEPGQEGSADDGSPKADGAARDDGSADGESAAPAASGEG